MANFVVDDRRARDEKSSAAASFSIGKFSENFSERIWNLERGAWSELIY
jgi:hypothetical protein